MLLSWLVHACSILLLPSATTAASCSNPPCELIDFVRPPLRRPLKKHCTNPPCEVVAFKPPPLRGHKRPGVNVPVQTTRPPSSEVVFPDSPYINNFRDRCGLRDGQRIVGGKQASRQDWTWTVALLRPRVDDSRRWEQFCGGTLLTDLHILTAAHCVDRRDVSAMRVRAGNVDIQEGESFTDERIAEKRQHPNFNTADLTQDIAILRLERPLRIGASISTCCLPEGEDPAGRSGIALGWGATDSTGAAGSATHLLQFIDLPILSNDECQQKYSRPIPRTALCAGRRDRNGFDSCSGDSGGPLVVYNTETKRWQLEGITSYGPLPCGQRSRPGVYTRVSAYRDWILENVT